MNNKISRPINRVTSAPPLKKKLDLDSLLTPQKKAELRQQAEDKVLAREIAAAEEEYLQQQMTAYDNVRHPEIVEEYRDISLDLPPYMDRITIDGRVFMHGGQYKVLKRVYEVLRDITWNAFKHDDVVNNRSNSNAYRRERELRMNAQTGGIVDNAGRPAVKF